MPAAPPRASPACLLVTHPTVWRCSGRRLLVLFLSTERRPRSPLTTSISAAAGAAPLRAVAAVQPHSDSLHVCTIRPSVRPSVRPRNRSDHLVIFQPPHTPINGVNVAAAAAGVDRRLRPEEGEGGRGEGAAGTFLSSPLYFDPRLEKKTARCWKTSNWK